MNRSSRPAQSQAAPARVTAGQYRRFFTAGVALIGLLLAGAWAVGTSESHEPARKPEVAAVASAPVIGATHTPTSVPPTPTTTPTELPKLAQSSLPAGSTTRTACVVLCLVRLPDSQQTSDFLGQIGGRAAYRHGNQVWTGLPETAIEQLTALQAPFEVLGSVDNPRELYVVRLPEWEDESVLDGIGEIVDHSENQYIVAMPAEPPYARGLIDLGISIEKFPPLLPPGVGQRPAPVTVGDLWEVAASVSKNQIEQRIGDLQAMGAQNGSFGTREYTTAGNVQTANYLYRRLASYGLSVHFEDFIADNGRLALNVVGEIPGADPSKVYLLTAHFDSRAEDTNDPAVAPGALDNGTGVAVLLEMARVLAQYELEHPVHVVFLNAEEYAMQGAYWFAEHVATSGTVTYAGGINVDSVGAALGSNQLLIHYDESSKWLADVVLETDRLWGFEVNVYGSNSAAIEADHTEIARSGIPMIMAASVLYGDPMINRSQDTIDQVDLWYTQEVAQLLILAMYDLVAA